ncbi:unnamed protein product [Scytosiphon promiscuus]
MQCRIVQVRSTCVKQTCCVCIQDMSCKSFMCNLPQLFSSTEKSYDKGFTEMHEVYFLCWDVECSTGEYCTVVQVLGIIFPSAEFYRFVLALEVGYRHAMLNPGLLAFYLGDLPAEVKRVVSSAGPVKAAWARCVTFVEDPLLGEAGGKGCTRRCGELYDFLVMKWHGCRTSAFA